MTLSVVQTFHGFTEGEMFYPHLFLIFLSLIWSMT